MTTKESWPTNGGTLILTLAFIDNTSQEFAEIKQVSANNYRINLKYRFFNADLVSTLIVLKHVDS